MYIPLKQRLLLQYRNPERAQILKTYRLSFQSTNRENGRSEDFFSGDLYNNFHIGQLELFGDTHDIALHLSLDGVQLTNMKHYEVIPIIFINLNLPPEERYLARNILASAIIPGPKKPKEIDTFLHPVVEELLSLDHGVEAFDGSTRATFQLRAWVTIVTGDGPAVADAMGMKAPGNAFRPCRTCMIKGERQSGRNKTYYVPHTVYGLQNLPVRTNLRRTIGLVEAAQSREYQQRLGINRSSILLRLRSLHFPRSFPADIMHCVLQNITPTLYKLWNGTKLSADDLKKRGMDREPYHLDAQVLEGISCSLAAARTDIPTSLGHAPRRITNHYNGFKAAEWDAWLRLFGVPLLDQHLDDEFVANFRKLGKFYDLATRHSLLDTDIRHISELSIEFVRTYEQLYYRKEPDRLPVCTVNIHYLLHFADYIRDCGPARYWWQFPMERYCGIIKPKASSKSQLSTSLANAVIIAEHLNHVGFVVTKKSSQEETLPRLLENFKPQMSHFQFRLLQATLDLSTFNMEGFKRCQLRRDLIIGSVQSQRHTDINRCNYRICYRQPDSHQFEFGEVQYFVRLSQFGDWAWIRCLQGVDIDRLKGVASFLGVGNFRWIRVDWILSLIGVLREAGVNFIVTDIDLFS